MAIKKESGYVPPKPPAKPVNSSGNRGYVPPKPPVKSPTTNKKS